MLMRATPRPQRPVAWIFRVLRLEVHSCGDPHDHASGRGKENGPGVQIRLSKPSNLDVLARFLA
jgi:hypothetical protein